MPTLLALRGTDADGRNLDAPTIPDVPESLATTGWPLDLAAWMQRHQITELRAAVARGKRAGRASIFTRTRPITADELGQDTADLAINVGVWINGLLGD